VRVQYQKGCGTGKKFSVSFTNQIAITPAAFSAGGDSGSLIVSEDGTPNPVGLLFRGQQHVHHRQPGAGCRERPRSGGHSFSFVGNACSSPGFAAAPGDPAFEMARLVKEAREKDLLGPARRPRRRRGRHRRRRRESCRHHLRGRVAAGRRSPPPARSRRHPRPAHPDGSVRGAVDDPPGPGIMAVSACTRHGRVAGRGARRPPRRARGLSAIARRATDDRTPPAGSPMSSTAWA